MLERSGNNPTPVERQYKEFHGDIDIFIPKDREAEHLSRHGIEVLRLENGAIIYGTTRPIADSASASIDIYFPSGSYREPQDLKGINHLLEHVIASQAGFESKKNDADFNAQTSSDQMIILANGTANLTIRDYGIWPVLDLALQEISHPPTISQAQLDTEKNVVLGEIQQRESSNIFIAGKIHNDLVFAADNPQNYETLGNNETLSKIALDDISSRFRAIFVPSQAEANVFVEGNQAITKELMLKIRATLGGLTQTSEPEKVDSELYANINPEFRQGATYRKDYGIKDKSVFIYYRWILPQTPWTRSSIATSDLLGIVQQRLFKFVRQNGLGYSSEANDTLLGSTKRLAGFSLLLPKKPNIDSLIDNLYSRLRKDVLESFNDQDFAHITSLKHKRLTAKPISVQQRLADARWGIRAYGKAIDTDKSAELYKSVSVEHLKLALDELISTPPATIIIGDLS